MTRRSLLAATALAPAFARGGTAPRRLGLDLLPPQLAEPLGIDEAWFSRQRERQAARIADGSAEHITYYLLQSRRFTDAAPIEPMRAAHERLAFPPQRAAAFLASQPTCERHRLIRHLYEELGWTLERCYEHTLAFLRAKEIDAVPLDTLYQQRGLSSDTAPESLAGLATYTAKADRVLLAGPGLDLTRREKFSDELPLKSHQWEYLRSRFPHVDAVDIRPEVVRHLGARRHDLITEVLPERYDLIVATNIFVYFSDAELLCAIASLGQSLNPGGVLLHNDMRFAAKVFGEALHAPVEKYEPVAQGGRKWDRIVIHRKGPQ